MNVLPLNKRAQIIQLLVEGNSLRAAARISGIAFNTVLKLLVTVGKAAEQFHNATVINVEAKRIQSDEIWSFVYAKKRNVQPHMKGAGDAWTWVAIDADSKLIVSWRIGNRNNEEAELFMRDLASRLKGRVQLTTDSLPAYMQAVGNAFDYHVDYGQLIKTYRADGFSPEKRYSPARFVAASKEAISGNPDEKYISTSHIERQNLTMRMHMRRFTRLTNAFSKKLENHYYALAIHFVYYNFIRVHGTIKTTPAIKAGLVKERMTIEDLVRLSDINA